MVLLRLPLRAICLPAHSTSSSRFLAARPLHTTTTLRFPRKDSQDKDSINTNPTEYSKSGGDPSSAQMDTAFDPNTTSPEGQEAKAAAESVCAKWLEHVMENRMGAADERAGAAVSGWLRAMVSFVLKVVAV